ncbi:MAG: ROK family protein [Anaerolineales bacterium]|jgi:glucokinase-like ROK family protein|nr:ROK family protein [Anaerolineales bacterium]
MNHFFWPTPFQNVKNINKHAVLDLIRFTPGGISRAALALRMDLSRAAMTAIVNDLLEVELVRETESRNGQSGRPPIILEINPARGNVVGIDMGATHLTIALADFSARVIDEIEIPFDITQGPIPCLAQVEALLTELLEKNDMRLEHILAIGMGVPGPIVNQAGMVISPPIMPGWDGYPIRLEMESKWNIPVSLNNDAELGMLGEWAYGAGRGEEHLAYIKVGSGIGAGLLLNGQVYQGATGSAGEIGHLTIEENGPLCDCGSNGCLEALAGGKAIARQAREVALSSTRTLLSSMGPPEELTARDVAAAARRGDLPSQQIIARAGSHLGIAIAGMVNLFNPRVVVIGGGVSQIGDLLLQPIRDTVRRRSLAGAAQVVKINTAILRRRSSIMGAIVQALSTALHQVADKKETQPGP